MLRTGFKRFCVIITGETEEEYKQLQLSHEGRVLEGFAYEQGWGVLKIVRLPLYDMTATEIKLTNILDDYLKNRQPTIWLMRDFSYFRTPRHEFFKPYMETIINEVLLNKLNLYESSTRTMIHSTSTTQAWLNALSVRHLHMVSRIDIINKHNGSKLEKLYNSIDWEHEPFYANCIRVTETHPDLFPTKASWLQNVTRDFGKIEGVYTYFRAMDDRIRKYILKESHSQQWSRAFSIFPIAETIKRLEKKFNSTFLQRYIKKA